MMNTEIDLKTNLKTKKIYLLRHGQTEYNKMGIVQGRGVDASLNEVGQQQADQFFQHYQNLHLDWVYTSSLKRAKETVAGFIKKGIGHTALDGLDEIHWGSMEGKPFSESDHANYQNVTSKWQQGFTDLSIAGGESPEEVQQRQKLSLEHLMRKDQEQSILVCMHGRAIRIFICLLLGYPLRSMDLFHHNNTGLYVVTYTGNHFRLDQVNNLEHLT